LLIAATKVGIDECLSESASCPARVDNLVNQSKTDGTRNASGRYLMLANESCPEFLATFRKSPYKPLSLRLARPQSSTAERSASTQASAPRLSKSSAATLIDARA
jgi:hypothetical protein